MNVECWSLDLMVYLTWKVLSQLQPNQSHMNLIDGRHEASSTETVLSDVYEWWSSLGQ